MVVCSFLCNAILLRVFDKVSHDQGRWFLLPVKVKKVKEVLQRISNIFTF